MFALFTIIKSSIHKKWLLIIFTTNVDVCSMLSQLSLLLTEILIFSPQKACGPKD